MTDNTCSICLEPLLSTTANTIGTAVPCGHCFHTKCFNRWKASRRTRIRVPCPNCNKNTDGFIKLFISCDILDLQCVPISNEDEPSPKIRKNHPGGVVVVPSPPRLISSPSRIAQDAPSSEARSSLSATNRSRTSNGTSSIVTNQEANTRPETRGPRLFLGARVQDSNQAPVVTRRRHSTRSFGRMLQLSKMVKDLKVAQQSIAKQVHDHRAIVFALGSCRQDQQTKRICKLRISQFQLSSLMEDHVASLEALPLDSLRRREKRRIEEIQQEFEAKKSVHREQVELVNTLYTTRLGQERSRVTRLREEQRQLNDTLRDYGAAIKGLLTSHNTNAAGIRLRGRKQRHLTARVAALGDAIQSINLNTLERDHVKKVKQVEDELIALVQRVGDHGASLQSLCSVHHFLGSNSVADHEC